MLKRIYISNFRHLVNFELRPGVLSLLMGPNGYFEMNEGVIRAAPHVHMHPDDAGYYGVKHKDIIGMRVHGALETTFENMLVRVDPSFKLEVHIDTDEGNACGLRPDTFCELINKV